MSVCIAQVGNGCVNTTKGKQRQLEWMRYTRSTIVNGRGRGGFRFQFESTTFALFKTVLLWIHENVHAAIQKHLNDKF